MTIIRSFRALRPPAERVKQVASVPYDVVNTAEARALAAENPLSFLHVSRPEIDLPDGTDPYSDQVYRKALENYERLIKECPLETEEVPSIYLYRLIMGEHEQIGVVACCSVDEYDQDIIRKHERTRRDKEDDRTRHMLVLRAQTGPVFLTYRASRDIDTMVMETTMANAIFDFTADDGVQHTVWRVPDPVRFVQAFREIPFLYIADGHHRAASAARARAELKEQSFGHTGDEEYNFFLAVMFPDDQLQILALQPRRAGFEWSFARTISGCGTQEFRSHRRRERNARQSRQMEHVSGRAMVYADSRQLVRRKPQGTVASLDVSILQDRLLDPILGIKDVRTDKRIDFIGGMRGTQGIGSVWSMKEKRRWLFRCIRRRSKNCCSVSDAGEIMPPKSTWFEPKLRDGLLIHTI